METLDAFLSSYGYWVFFAVGFAEFVGVPIVSVPVLIGGGALVATGTLGFWGVVVSVAAGGWLADLGWYTVGRRQGSWLIDMACGLWSNPRACVSMVKDRLSRLGTPYILLAKLLPGSGNLIAVSAGLAGFGTLPFILADAASLILWASIYTGIGWILSDHVVLAIEWALTYNRAVVVVLMLIVLAAAWRLWKVRFQPGSVPTHKDRAGDMASQPFEGSAEPHSGRTVRQGSWDLEGGFSTPEPVTQSTPQPPLCVSRRGHVHLGTTRALHALDDCDEPSLGETKKTVR